MRIIENNAAYFLDYAPMGAYYYFSGDESHTEPTGSRAKGNHMDTTKKVVVANWVGGGKFNGEYVTINGWHSADGDSWTDNSGQPMAGADFDSATIELRGGFRDGEVVA